MKFTKRRLVVNGSIVIGLGLSILFEIEILTIATIVVASIRILLG